MINSSNNNHDLLGSLGLTPSGQNTIFYAFSRPSV
jgi:hypothetical protein